MREKEEINKYNAFGFKYGFWEDVYSTGEIAWRGKFHLDNIGDFPFFMSSQAGLWTWYFKSGTIAKTTIFII